MAFNLIVSTKATVNGAAGLTTPAVDTSGANLIVISISGDNGTPSDSKGNTWTALTDAAGNPTARLFYSANPTVGVGHTFTSPSAFCPIFVAAFSSGGVSPFDQENTAQTASNVVTLSPGSITPTLDNELVVSALGTQDPADTHAINSSMSIVQSTNGASGVSFGGGLAYIVQTTATAINPAWSWNDACPASAVIASFKVATTSPSASASASSSASRSASASESKSQSPSASSSRSASASASASASPTDSPSSSASASGSSSASPSLSPSASQSPSSSVSASPSPASYVNKYEAVDNSYANKYSATNNTFIDKYREWEDLPD